MGADETKPHHPALDGLRAFAILLVMANHGLFRYAAGGTVGVDIFFVLSGFLITGVLLRPGTSLRLFYLRRAQRLYPALICAVALSYPLWPYTHPVSRFVPSAIKALFYVANVSEMHGSMLGALGHTWSLAAEEQFYLLWPLALFMIPALRTSWRTIGAAIVLVMIGRAALLHTVPQLVGYFSPLCRIDELLTGAALCVAGGSLSGIRRLAPLSLVAAVVFCVAYRGSWTTFATFLLPLASFGTATIIAACVAPPTSLVQRLLSRRPLVWLGKRSYGIYLYHMPIFYAVGGALAPRNAILAVTVPAALSILVAHISYTFIEQPILRVRLGDSRPAPAGHAM
ncbi:MAG TPA: acyltransferase [Polyangia bacterium]|nr:acyltransferase [Polyangia bacterium]